MNNDFLVLLKKLNFWKNYNLCWIPSTASTNDDLKDIWRSEGFEHTIEVADVQTRGKGQYDRKWASDEVGQCLMFSFTVDVKEYLFPISMIAGISLAAALENMGVNTKDFWLKWPNDIWLNNRKLAGILTESTTFYGGFRTVVGIGINILPLQDKSINAASLSEAGLSTNREEALFEFCKAWDKIFILSASEQTELWKKYGGQFWKREMTIALPKGETLVAVPESVEKDGALIVRKKDGSLQKIISATLLPKIL